MYILLISRGYIPKEEPLWGCFEIQQAEALKKAGHKVIVACVDDRLVAEDRPLRCLEWPGFRKFVLKDLPIYTSFIIPRRIATVFGFSFYNKIYSWQFNRLYKMIVKDYGKPDVIYSHYMRLNFYAANLQEKYKVPAVGVEHWSEINKPDVDQGIVNLGKKTYHRLSKLIAVSQPLANRMEVLFNVEPIVIHNIVDINYNAYSRLSSNSDLVRIVTVGRLSSPKKINLIIQALSKPCFKNLKWELTIVGTGPLEKELKELNEKVKLADRIHFVGQKSHDEVCEILSKSDFFVLASQYETFGVVFVEAMSFGLPVIGTKCGGPEIIINKNNGLLVPNDDVNAMADALKYMMVNYKNYSAEAIKKEVKEKYSPEVIVPKIEKVLKQAIEENIK